MMKYIAFVFPACAKMTAVVLFKHSVFINPAIFIAGLIAWHRDVPPQAIGLREPSKIKPVRTQAPNFSGRQSNRSGRPV